MALPFFSCQSHRNKTKPRTLTKHLRLVFFAMLAMLVILANAANDANAGNAANVANAAKAANAKRRKDNAPTNRLQLCEKAARAVLAQRALPVRPPGTQTSAGAASIKIAT